MKGLKNVHEDWWGDVAHVSSFSVQLHSLWASWLQMVTSTSVELRSSYNIRVSYDSYHSSLLRLFTFCILLCLLPFESPSSLPICISFIIIFNLSWSLQSSAIGLIPLSEWKFNCHHLRRTWTLTRRTTPLTWTSTTIHIALSSSLMSTTIGSWTCSLVLGIMSGSTSTLYQVQTWRTSFIKEMLTQKLQTRSPMCLIMAHQPKC